MGHLVGKDIYRKLGKKIDNLTLRAPWNKEFYHILKALYSEEEADIVVKMPFGLSNFELVSKITKYEQLHKLGGWVKRAKPFIEVDGKRQTRLVEF